MEGEKEEEEWRSETKRFTTALFFVFCLLLSLLFLLIFHLILQQLRQRSPPPTPQPPKPKPLAAQPFTPQLPNFQPPIPQLPLSPKHLTALSSNRGHGHSTAIHSTFPLLPSFSTTPFLATAAEGLSPV